MQLDTQTYIPSTKMACRSSDPLYGQEYARLYWPALRWLRMFQEVIENWQLEIVIDQVDGRCRMGSK